MAGDFSLGNCSYGHYLPIGLLRRATDTRVGH
jgi:hypothetical protein